MSAEDRGPNPCSGMDTHRFERAYEILKAHNLHDVIDDLQAGYFWQKQYRKDIANEYEEERKGWHQDFDLEGQIIYYTGVYDTDEDKTS